MATQKNKSILLRLIIKVKAIANQIKQINADITGLKNKPAGGGSAPTWVEYTRPEWVGRSWSDKDDGKLVRFTLGNGSTYVFRISFYDSNNDMIVASPIFIYNPRSSFQFDGNSLEVMHAGVKNGSGFQMVGISDVTHLGLQGDVTDPTHVLALAITKWEMLG